MNYFQLIVVIFVTQKISFNNLILVFKNNSSHFTLLVNRVKCEKQILLLMRFKPMTSCVHGKRLTARPQGLHSKDQTTPRLIFYIPLKYIFRHRKQICFSLFTLFRVKFEELFWKTNIKLIKLINFWCSLTLGLTITLNKKQLQYILLIFSYLVP